MSLPALEPWYVTGLVDGSGSFTFSRSGSNIGLYLTVRRPAVDLPLLEALRGHFGDAGTIYAGGPAGAQYRVTRNADLGRVLDHFDAYPLRSRKAAAFAIWREMVELKRAFRQPDRERLARLAEALTRANADVARDRG